MPRLKQRLLAALRQGDNVFAQIDRLGKDWPVRVDLRATMEFNLWFLNLTLVTQYPWATLQSWCKPLVRYATVVETKVITGNRRLAAEWFADHFANHFEHRVQLQVPVSQVPPNRMDHISWRFDMPQG